jgi:hypothetical protein
LVLSFGWREKTVLGFAQEKNRMVMTITKQISENPNRAIHIKGCIWGIKKYPKDNLSLTSLGYGFN